MKGFSFLLQLAEIPKIYEPVLLLYISEAKALNAATALLRVDPSLGRGNIEIFNYFCEGTFYPAAETGSESSRTRAEEQSQKGLETTRRNRARYHSLACASAAASPVLHGPWCRQQMLLPGRAARAPAAACCHLLVK